MYTSVKMPECLSLLAYAVNFLLDCQLAERGKRQAQKERNSAVENHKSFPKRALDLFGRALHGGGSGTPQCAVIGWPGHTGQTSLAALSQTVNTKSICGAPGFANSSQLLLRKPSTGMRANLDLPQRLGANLSRRMAARAIGDESWAGPSG